MLLTRRFSLSLSLGGDPESAGSCNLAPALQFSVSALRMKLTGSEGTAIDHSVLLSPIPKMTTSDGKVGGVDAELMSCIWRQVVKTAMIQGTNPNCQMYNTKRSPDALA